MRRCSLLLLVLAVLPGRARCEDLTEAQVLELLSQGIPLGGNVDRSYLVEMPDGSTVVYTTRGFQDAQGRQQALRTLETARSLAQEGVFARVVGSAVKLYGPERGDVVIAMENMNLSRSGKPVISSGDLRDVDMLRDLPLETRLAVRNELLSKLVMHPDGHGMNIRWRRVPTQSGSRVDVRLIDPFPEPNSLLARAALIGTAPRGNPFIDQYIPAAQMKYLDARLKIPVGEVHPDIMLHIGRGYGMAAEASFAPELEAAASLRSASALGTASREAALPVAAGGRLRGLRAKVPYAGYLLFEENVQNGVGHVLGSADEAMGVPVFEQIKWIDPTHYVELAGRPDFAQGLRTMTSYNVLRDPKYNFIDRYRMIQPRPMEFRPAPSDPWYKRWWYNARAFTIYGGGKWFYVPECH